MILDVDDFLKIKDPMIIDMRTKQEYHKGHIHKAYNFEILNYDERKEVSILFNSNQRQGSYLLAYKYALDKLPKLLEFIQRHLDRDIVFYCARGGSRSTIVYDVFKGLPDVSIFKLKGGFKNYRRYVNDVLSSKSNEISIKVLHYPALWPLSGENELDDQVIKMIDYSQKSAFMCRPKTFSYLQFKLDIFYKFMQSGNKEIVIMDLNSRRIFNDMPKNLKELFIRGNHACISKPMHFRVNELINDGKIETLFKDIKKHFEYNPDDFHQEMKEAMSDHRGNEEVLKKVLRKVLEALDKDARKYLRRFNID